MNALFVTGTGTDVGKTVTTAVLASGLSARGQSVCVYKPVQTGSEDPARPVDLHHLRTWLGEADAVSPPVQTYCSYSFGPPAAPYVADEARTIEPRRLLQDFKRLQQQYDVVLVEGAGGVRVPIAPRFDMRDLIRMLQVPVLVVASPQLGTINHTVLTVESLRQQRLDVVGVVVSGLPADSADPAVQTLMDTLEAFCPVPLWAPLPLLSLSPGSLRQPDSPHHAVIMAWEPWLAEWGLLEKAEPPAACRVHGAVGQSCH